MKSFRYTITDPVGIHARPAGNLVSVFFGVQPCGDGQREAVDVGETLLLARLDKACNTLILKRVMVLQTQILKLGFD